jgi:hypothetical protein
MAGIGFFQLHQSLIDRHNEAKARFDWENEVGNK